MDKEILLFGVLTDIAGSDTIVVKNINNLDELKSALLEKFPAFANYSFRFAVNNSFTENNIGICETDEIAVLPPFSGG